MNDENLEDQSPLNPQDLIENHFLGTLSNDESKRLEELLTCLLYTSPSPRDRQKSRMPSSA